MEPRPHEPPPTITDSVLGLLIMAGFLMVVSALPVGAALVYKDYQFHKDWLWALVLGAVVAMATAIVGSLLILIGYSIAKWRWRMQEMANARKSD